MTGATSPTVGLTTVEARQRLHRWGANVLPEPRVPGLMRRLLTQVAQPLVLLLVAAAAVALFALHDLREGIVILVIVALDVAVGAVQERRADRAMATLRDLTAPTARIWRDRELQVLPAADLVVGDVAEVLAGDRVPADLTLHDARSLAIDEALLTGESLPVAKPAGSRALAGTLVVRGRGQGETFATGAATELGRIAAELAPPDPSPVQQELREVGRTMAVLAIIVGALLVPVAAMRSNEPDAWLEGLLAGVALAVAAIPEGLPAAVTIALALGAQRMVKRGAIVRRLAAIETLGCTTVLCSDKTGTLTTGQLTLTSAHAVRGRDSDLWRAALRCNDALGSGNDPVDEAIVNAARSAGVDFVPSERRIDERPFDAETRLMATVHEGAHEQPVLSVKGAPEVVLGRCRPSADVDELWRDINAATAEGKRVLAVAEAPTVCLDATDLEALGVLIFEDPLRPSATAAVRRCRDAGIRVVLVTGDHRRTAASIARKVGLDDEPVVTGDELRTLEGSERERVLAAAAVLARVDPDLKVELVTLHRARGAIVAMTGDGVNDAPALRHANIGVAVAGQGGTDVAREAADVIVTNGDLGTLVGAVEEGRRIYRNLSNVVEYLVTGNLSEIAVVAFGLLVLPELAVPLLPVHILWINLVTDGLPALALGIDAPAGDALGQPPRSHSTRLLDRRRLGHMAGAAGVIGALVLGAGRLAYEWGWSEDVQRTQLLVTLVLTHLALAYVVRAQRSTLERGAFGGRMLRRAIAASVFVQVMLIAFPSTRSWLDLAALPPAGWLVALIAVGLEIVVLDAVRAARRGATTPPTSAVPPDVLSTHVRQRPEDSVAHTIAREGDDL